IGQQGNDPLEFNDRPRPPVREQERQGVRSNARLVDEVQVDSVERYHELLETIEACLVGAPVVGFALVGRQRSYVRQVTAVLPGTSRSLVRPAGTLQS